MRWLTAIPVYNEAKSVAGVLSEARRHAEDLLVVDKPPDKIEIGRNAQHLRQHSSASKIDERTGVQEIVHVASSAFAE